jgi:hypothetical protein
MKQAKEAFELGAINPSTQKVYNLLKKHLNVLS